MATSVEALEAEVLRLSPADRRACWLLIASLDTDAETETAWDAIADAREAELNSGKVESVPFEEAVAQLDGNRAPPWRRARRLENSMNVKARPHWRRDSLQSSSESQACWRGTLTERGQVLRLALTDRQVLPFARRTKCEIILQCE